MSTPSLLNIPYRLKAGTLYSQLPETGAGDFTVTRTTTVANRSTRINSQGFIEIVNDNVPRLDYPLGGAVNGCPALLVEPAATNLVPNGVGFNVQTGVLTSSVTDSPAVAISGTLMTKNEASGTTRYGSQTFSASALASATTYSVSRFFKYNGVAFNTSLEASSAPNWGNVGWKQVIVLSASGVTLGASTLCTSTVQNFGNGWYRVNVSVTTGAAPSGATVNVLSELPSAFSTGQGFLTACPQLELGSIATSYIPTTTAAVTRSAEAVSKTGVSSLIGQTEGTLYAEVVYSSIASTKTFVAINDGTVDNRIALRIISTTSISATVVVAGVSHTISATIPAIPSSGVVKIALGYKANDYALAINGTIYPFTTTRPVPPTTAAFLGNNGFNSDYLNDRIRAAALYPNRLPDTAGAGVLSLATLTTP